MILFGFIIFPLIYILINFLPVFHRLKQGFAVVFALINILLSVALLAEVNDAGMVKLEMGSWQAPYGIVLVADRFSAFMIAISALVILATVLYSYHSIDEERKQTGYFQFLFGIVMGVNGSFIAGDLFNLYVWFEVMLMSSFILMSHGGERKQLEGSIKYLILNLVSSFFFVAGIGLLYGKIGTLNLADISYKIFSHSDPWSSITSPLALIMVGFAIKGALFPFFFWLPASYHTPPPAVSALFAGLLTKVGIYSIIRFYTLVLYTNHEFWNLTVLSIGVLSMVIGVFTATSQYDFRKILSFHIISQVGYVIIGLAFFTINSLAAAIFFLGHNMMAKTNTYLVAGWVEKRTGTLDLKALGDLFRENKIWSILFFISAFSLAGIPPLSGFVGKYAIIKSGIDSGHMVVALVALFVGIFTLFSMLKIWMEVFWKQRPETVESSPKQGPEKLMVAGSALLALGTVGMGLAGIPVMDYCNAAAADLMDPSRYVEFVLN
ncbi:MAG: pH regulation protein D [Marinilabiliaceae bacterium]|nr:pH regulation protein D [Marinilabiliaceae bacterium]